jgi:hypothetical protein
MNTAVISRFFFTSHCISAASRNCVRTGKHAADPADQAAYLCASLKIQ